MNASDHLFYLICHALKHFYHSGFGIRQVCDILLFAAIMVRDQLAADLCQWPAASLPLLCGSKPSNRHRLSDFVLKGAGYPHPVEAAFCERNTAACRSFGSRIIRRCPGRTKTQRRITLHAIQQTPCSKYLAEAVPGMDPCIFSDFSGNGTSISMASFKAMDPSRRMVSTMAALFFGTKVIPADFSRIICHKNRCPPNPSDAVLPVDT